ncbi:MAG: hypothetical protein WDM96_14525 [Lacunisphaera sp.]
MNSVRSKAAASQTPSWPLAPYIIPPVVRLPTNLIDPAAIVPSYLQG